MNGRFQDEMNRFEAEIQHQNNFGRPPNSMRMFIPPQMRGMRPPPHMMGGPPGMMPPRPHMLGGPPGMSLTRLPIMNAMGLVPNQGVIAARPTVTISAPAQTITNKVDDDDDILATLQKYEAEVKKDTKKTGLTPSQVTSQQKKGSHLMDAVKSTTTTTIVNRVPPPPPPAPDSVPQQGEKSGDQPPRKREKKQKRFVRTGGGQIWEDETLKEWDPSDFRLFCGDLGNDVTDEVLIRTFSRYASFHKAKVIRDKKTNKTKGFGFVSFKDPLDFTKAMKELNGKYVGSRPIKLRKSNWKDRNIEVVKNKQKLKQQMGYKV